MNARALIRQGFDDLVRARAATTAAWLASLAAALAVEAALRSAGADLRRPDGVGDLLHAMLVLPLGLVTGSLLLDCARAVALTAYARPGQPWLAAGMSRVPALITVTAVELTVEGFLGLGLFVTLPRVLESRSALASALVVAPVVFVGAVIFAAGRVALVLAARGVAPSAALMHGFDVVLRRLPSLTRLGAALLLYTLPLTLTAVALRVAAGMGHAGAAAAGRALALGLVELAVLLGYAALANLVGRDPRLTTG